jgi:hypothetical protein
VDFIVNYKNNTGGLLFRDLPISGNYLAEKFQIKVNVERRARKPPSGLAMK